MKLEIIHSNLLNITQGYQMQSEQLKFHYDLLIVMWSELLLIDYDGT